jgi:pimeloyl-ACP methyl ester carboxylesterase
MTTGTQVRDLNITLNGLRFHYRDWGNESAPTLILLHGLSSHARSWDTLASAMCDRYHVLALDQRGHGESEWAAEYSAERRVEDMAAFVQAMGLERFNLLGLSMGGICAYGYAARRPETLERLVIVDIAPTLETGGINRIFGNGAAKSVFDDPEEAVAQARAVNPRADEHEQRHRTLHNLKQTADGKWTWRYDPANFTQNRSRASQPDPEATWASLANITCPTLVIRGALSDLLGPAAAQRMAATIPDCRLIEVPDAGHSVPLENPAGFIAAVKTFL